MSKKIMAVNAGSSSLKFQLLDMPDEAVLAKGIFEKIGSDQALFSLEYGGQKDREILAVLSHSDAVRQLLAVLLDRQILQSLEEIDGVGHRVAHGGDYFADAVCIDKGVLSAIEELSDLAPSHNTVSLAVIRSFQEAMPQVKQAAVFDTSFHQSLPEEYYRYPIPQDSCQRCRIRKYGFHGISHHYIAQTAAELWQAQGEPAEGLRIISCHLGNGNSICAIKNGCSLNTSMGFTPLAGLMMGSRSGDIDPMILPFLMEKEGLTIQEIGALLNQQSGLLAVSQLSNDVRDILKAYDRQDERAVLAIRMFVNRIAQTIAAYMTDLEGLDALVFTAGIGENAALIRRLIVRKLRCLGLSLNPAANEQGQTFIQSQKSRAKILILPTNEELMIARDTVRVVGVK